MSVSLSKKLNFRLNDYPVILQQPLNEPELVRHGIKKAGLLARLMLKPARGETIFWSKNCTLQYLNDDRSGAIAPVVAKESPPERRFSTTAFFHFTANTLSGFAFQITNISASANVILGDFEEKITTHIGEASAIEPFFKTWTDARQQLIVDFPADKRHGYVHLIRDPEAP